MKKSQLHQTEKLIQHSLFSWPVGCFENYVGERARNTVEPLVRETSIAQGMPSKIFEEVFRQGSKLTPRKVFHNFITSIFSSGGHEVKTAVSWSSLETLLTWVSETVPGIFKATRKDMMLPVTMIPIIELAKEAWKKCARKDLLLNYGCAILKGGINMMTNLPWDILASRLRDDGFFIDPLYPFNDLLYSDKSF